MTADSRQRLVPQAVLDAIPGAVAQLGPAGEILGVNATWRTLAASGRLLPGTNVTQHARYLDACDRAAARGVAAAADAAAAIRSALGGGSPAPLEYRLAASHATFWSDLHATPLHGDGYTGALVVHADISARKVAAEGARATEAPYRAIVESAPVGIYQATADGRILSANQSLADIVGAPSPDALIGSNITAFYANASAAEPIRHDPNDGAIAVEVEWRRLDNVPIWVEMATGAIHDPLGGTLYHEGFIYDISERKHREAELAQSQKMESIGRLAGGIAHDFNNLLTVMIGYAEMLHDTPGLPGAVRAPIVEILAAARRAAELTDRMLAFARRQRVQPRAVGMNDVVRGIEGLLRRSLGEGVRLDVALGDLRPVLIDPAQLEQVLMNLAVNARDAMPTGGRLTITTDAVEIAPDEARRRPGLRSGRYVRLRVADTGVGMDAQTLGRIFEPFFTTKEPGKGTGLGLAMCYGVVKQAGGFISCESTVGVGTTCTVLMPEATAARALAETPQAIAAHSPALRRATILVVDDEPPVRQFVAEVLRASGHVVFQTGSPEESMEIAAKQGERLDLLVTDIVMPQMDGVALATHLRQRWPGLRVLLMSGYQFHGQSQGDTTAPLLSKPFSAAQLLDRVEALLRDGPNA